MTRKTSQQLLSNTYKEIAALAVLEQLEKLPQDSPLRTAFSTIEKTLQGLQHYSYSRETRIQNVIGNANKGQFALLTELLWFDSNKYAYTVDFALTRDEKDSSRLFLQAVSTKKNGLEVKPLLLGDYAFNEANLKSTKLLLHSFFQYELTD